MKLSKKVTGLIAAGVVLAGMGTTALAAGGNGFAYGAGNGSAAAGQAVCTQENCDASGTCTPARDGTGAQNGNGGACIQQGDCTGSGSQDGSAGDCTQADCDGSGAQNGGGMHHGCGGGSCGQ
jgi:hypothetical protein